MKTKLTEDEMREAWKQTWKKYRGKKWYEIDIWLSRQVRQLPNWIAVGGKIIDQCNVYLDEMSEKYGD